MPRPSLFSFAGKIGAYRQHARHDNDTAGPARAAFFRRFEDEVDPDHLPAALTVGVGIAYPLLTAYRL